MGKQINMNLSDEEIASTLLKAISKNPMERSLPVVLWEAENAKMEQMPHRTGGHIGAAAKMLGIQRTTMQTRLKRACLYGVALKLRLGQYLETLNDAPAESGRNE